MNYEERYKAVEKAARELLRKNVDDLAFKHWVEDTFSEEESEDVRCRRALCKILKGVSTSVFEQEGVDKDRILAWTAWHRQPELSEKDKVMIERISNIFASWKKTEEKEWLESFVQRGQWRPSKVQISTLDEAINKLILAGFGVYIPLCFLKKELEDLF